MKMEGGVDVWIHVFFTSALVGGEWSASSPCRFTPPPPGGKSPGIRCRGVSVNPRVDLNDMEKGKFLTLQGLELLP
jgi:hypothetical protein